MAIDVLIVEDEPVVARSAARILGSADLAARVVGDAASAIAELERESPRLVLCDLMLPGDSGFRILETATRLRLQTEVIMISGYATCENALESFARGAFDFLPKPFDVGELLAPVTRALRFLDRPAGGESPQPPPLSTPVEATALDSELHLLGRHSWVSRDPDGSATIGLGESFPGLLGETVAVDLPAANEHLLQCRRCALVRASDGLEHRVWAPLSGRVIAVNRDLTLDPSGLDREPWSAYWLVRILPEAATEELSKLEPR